MEAEKARLQEAAENAIFLVEGWENLGWFDDSGKLEKREVWRGKSGPWSITIQVLGQDRTSESCKVEATAANTELQQDVTFSPHMARVAFRRATQDARERTLWSLHPRPNPKKSRRRR
jgi:hypothetical protein